MRAGAGLTWGELDAATQAHGLATVGGRVLGLARVVDMSAQPVAELVKGGVMDH